MLNKLNIPYADQYVGVWAIKSEHFNTLLGQAQNINLQVHYEQSQDPEKQAAIKKRAATAFDTTRDGSIAVVELQGSLAKHASSFSGSQSMVAARRQLRSAASDPRVTGIMLKIDSPGGTVAGTADLADDIAAAAKLKPVHAYIEDLGASAAYWLASQADKITANKSAEVGSIGVFSVVTDWSALAEKEGAKVNVIRFGEFKGAGVAGTEITDDQLAEWQKSVDAYGEMFVAAIAKGRGMSIAQVKQLADGKIHIASDAVELSLIDGVGSFEAAVDGLADAARQNTSTRGAKTMADKQENAVDQPATLAELKANLTGATSDFILAQLEAGATVAQAMRGHLEQVVADNAKLATEKEAAEKVAAEAVEKQASRGVSGLGDSGDSEEASGDAVELYMETFNGYLSKGLSRAQAASKMARHHNDLRLAYLETANQ